MLSGLKFWGKKNEVADNISHTSSLTLSHKDFETYIQNQIRQTSMDLIANVNKAVVRARYMEIITGFSDNLEGTISDSYDDVIEAILAKSGTELKKNVQIAGLIQGVAQGEEGEKTKKEPGELTCDEILARTWIGIEGDTVMLLPRKGGGKIDPQMIELHKANVDVSVQNWRYILDTIMNAVRILAGLAGSPRTLPTSK